MFAMGRSPRLSGISILVLLFALPSLASTDGSPKTDCPRGWFGPNCQYLCHCDPSDTCGRDGACPKCEKGWFGPACQYVDLLKTGHLSSATTATNNSTFEDGACGSHMLWLHVSWDNPVFFTWLRLSFGDEIQGLGDIKITLKETNNNDGTGKTMLDCTNQRTAQVDSKTVDIYCDVDLAVKQVNISGANLASSSLCAVYISGGRNVALKQNTSQSSMLGNYASDLAVDGNRNSNLDMHSCTHTDDNDRNPSWSLNFTATQSLHRYILYNRDGLQERLKGFTIEAFDPDGQRVFQYTDTLPSPQLSYNVISSSIKSVVSQVKISSAQKDGNGHITLCEVEIYGDSVCPHGSYGPQCENQCNCAVKSEQCFVSSGACPSGCPSGYHQVGCQKACESGRWGMNCLQSCDYRCNGNQCNPANGRCVNGCKAGFQEPSCTKACKDGTYGTNCASVCPSNCKDMSCDIVTGKCHQCQEGYTGDVCDKVCESGRYGEDCNHSCSNLCLNQLCHHENGSCVSCPLGKRGDQCDEGCPPGWHGYNCNNPCSATCDGNKSCDPAHGNCLGGCQKGYQGETCSEKCPATTYGVKCLSNCSQGCQLKDGLDPTVCHHVTGSCHFGCRSGYEGPTCGPAADNYTIWAIVGTVVVLALILLLAFYLWKSTIVRSWILSKMCGWSRARDIENHDETDIPLLDEEKDHFEMDNFVNDSNKVIDNNLGLHRFGEALRRQ
ncbi:unnamed protein product [Lymnaea stagnalis]|uniref:EGF-like domain-containing protein n=1 Tax=Lymnaea stagnalis TaxID=6523 RepID=A0AAV2HIA5_LYMST